MTDPYKRYANISRYRMNSYTREKLKLEDAAETLQELMDTVSSIKEGLDDIKQIYTVSFIHRLYTDLDEDGQEDLDGLQADLIHLRLLADLTGA